MTDQPRARSVRLSGHRFYPDSFTSDGRCVVHITGATRGGEGAQHSVTLELSEYALRTFVRQLRSRFVELQQARARTSRANLSAFEEPQR